MGYRSDVGYVIRFADEATLKEFVAVNIIDSEVKKQALNECEVSTAKGCHPELVFSSQDTKWYSNFEDVQAHEEMLESLDEGEIKAGYVFIRIGEEDDDLERK